MRAIAILAAGLLVSPAVSFAQTTPADPAARSVETTQSNNRASIEAQRNADRAAATASLAAPPSEAPISSAVGATSSSAGVSTRPNVPLSSPVNPPPH